MRTALFCSALTFVLLAGGCGSSSCPDKAKLCAGLCVDENTDPLNCGSCGNACGAGQACTNGTCNVVCPAGSSACGNLCVNTNTDQANCGACGNQCSSGQACSAGVCGTSCLAGFTVCGEDGGTVTCANLSTDSASCGSCGFACPAGSVCNGNGACAADCASGFSGCKADGGETYCADFTTDNQNCGSCNSPCPSGEACSASQCATTCAPGFNSCNGVDGGVGTCANFLTDTVNCGSCGHVCPGGTTCSGGKCTETCASGFTACTDGGYCANFLTDSVNCGNCGKACPAGQACNGGTCVETCATGFSACADAGAQYCANFLSDNANCGACGNPCGAGQVCSGAGVCGESCATGYSACADAGTSGPYCANKNTDNNNCGTCGTACAAGKACSGGKCVESCATGYTACSNRYCANLTSDVNNCGACAKTCSGFEAAGCCSSTCTSLSNGDPNNCGSCGTTCSGTQPGCCEAGCVDLATDANNCGGCGTACATGVTPACCPSSGAGACTDSWTDANNCGSCGTVCSSGICAGNCCTSTCNVDLTTNCFGSCDANGTCSHPTCKTGYGCGLGNTCKTACDSTADCEPGGGYACLNPPGGSCCPPLLSGGTLYLDGKLGSDTGCCSAASPCQTLTHAMSVISTAGVSGVTISVAWNAKPSVRSDWAPANGETYPVHLGLGVTLKAPGIFFTPSAGGAASDVFDVYAYNGSDTGTVTIVGDPTADYMFIGFDSKQANLTSATIAVNSGVASQTAVPLSLKQVWMNAQTSALNLGAGANVTLGPLPVIIGSGVNTSNPLTGVTSPGNGIYCQGTATSPASLSDVSGGSGSVLQIDSQATSHSTTQAAINSYDFCTITLSQNMVIGPAPACPSPKVDGEPFLVQGSSTVSLTGATLQCSYNHGFDVGESPTLYTGTPTLALSKTLIQYTGQTALKINSGTVSPVTNTTIYHSRFGVIMQQTGSIDLSGGGNMSVCNTNAEPGAYGPANAPGVDVWNETAAASLDASNMAWDANPPAYWTCTDPANTTTANTCSCTSGNCLGNNIEVPDSSDAVTAANTNATPIVLKNPTLETKYICN